MTNTRMALYAHARQTQTDARAVASHVERLLGWTGWPGNVEDITAGKINSWVQFAQKGGLSPSTIQTRLSVLKKAMARAGVAWPVDVKMPQRSKRPKWVLPQDAQDKLIYALLHGQDRFEKLPAALRQMVVDYIELVTETGLRVEEVLRILPHHVMVVDAKPILEVMGTKTAGSYDLIPLSSKAVKVLTRRLLVGAEGGHLFPYPYSDLRLLWNLCLEVLGVTDETATLKSLRRTFAARKAAKGIPTTLLQKLMRHASLVTTSHYTNTIGLHEAAREWLD